MYELSDDFSTRTAMSPFKRDNIIRINKKQIYVASKDLYNAVKDKDINDLSFNKSIKKYNLRSYSRTTPFGLFSTFDYCDFKSKVQDSSKIHVDFDGEWIYNAIKTLENKYLEDLFVVWNQTTTKNIFDKVENVWNSNNNHKFTIENVMINNTNAVKIIHDNTLQPNSVKLLCQLLSQAYPNMNEADFLKFISQLIAKEFLLSDLDSCAYSNDKAKELHYFMSNHETTDEEMNLIINRVLQIRASNNFQLNELMELENDMEHFVKSKSYLKIEQIGGNFKYNVDRTKIQKDLNNAIEFLTDTAQYFNDSEVVALNNYFIEKYGYEKVKLTEFFEQYKIDKTKIQKDTLLTKDVGEFNKYFIEQLNNLSSIRNDSSSFDLTNIIKTYKFDKVFAKPLSFTLATYITSSESESKYVTSPVVGSNSLCRLQGRFSNYEPSRYSRLEQTENNLYLDNGIIFVDVHYSPSDKHLTNIIDYNFNDDNYSLNFGFHLFNNSKCISLNNIYVTTNGNQLIFLLKTNNLEKIVMFRQKNMSNVTLLAPDILTFLIKNSEKYFGSPFSTFEICSNITEKYIYFPEITCGNLVIQPNRWNLSRFFEDDYLIKKEDFVERLNALKSKYKVDDLVYITNQDQRLLVNLFDDIDIIYDIYRKHKLGHIFLESISFDYTNLVTSKDDDLYLTEFLLNFTLKDHKSIKLESCLNNKHRFGNRKQIAMLNQHWIYFKLYCESTHQNMILNNISAMLQKFKFYFIRYVDNDKKSLRLRVFSNNQTETYTLINKELYKLYQNQYISDFEFCIYQPEIQRYGGLNFYTLIEEYFCTESDVFLNFINLDNNQSRIKRLNLAYFLILNFILSFFDSNSTALSFLNTRYDEAKHRESYRARKSSLANLFKKPPISIDDIQLLITSITKIKDHYLSHKISSDHMNSIIYSIFHMTCNRIIEVKPNEEEEIVFLCRHFINDIVNKEKYCSVK